MVKIDSGIMKKERTEKCTRLKRLECDLSDPEFNRLPKEGYGFIYRYTFRNGMKYIGQTVRSICERTRNHKSRTMPCDKLIHSGAPFIIEILSECKIEYLNDAERYCIEYFNTIFPIGLNMTYGGQDYKIYTDEVKEKIRKHHQDYYKDKDKRNRQSKIMKEYYRRYPDKKNDGSKISKSIICLEANKIYRNGKEISEDTGLTSVGCIYQSIRGNIGTIKGMHWIYTDWMNGNSIEDVLDCLKEWDKIKKKHKLTHKGYKKITINDLYEKDGEYKKRHIENTRNAVNKTTSIPIRCIETNMIYSSMNEAARELNINPSAISAAFKKGKNYCKGYHFEKIEV